MNFAPVPAIFISPAIAWRIGSKSSIFDTAWYRGLLFASLLATALIAFVPVELSNIPTEYIVALWSNPFNVSAWFVPFQLGSSGEFPLLPGAPSDINTIYKGRDFSSSDLLDAYWIAFFKAAL